MIIWNAAEQGSEEWLKNRSTLLTASNFSTAMGKPGATRLKLMQSLAAARVWGAVEPSFSSPAMMRGTCMEPQARAMFELDTGLEVDEVGLCTNSDYPDLGASLDGLVSPSEGIEIKCPLAHTMTGYRAAQRLPAPYKWQVHGQMLIAELETVHFYAFHPNIPPMHIVVRRDEKLITELQTKLGEFIDELKILEGKLNA